MRFIRIAAVVLLLAVVATSAFAERPPAADLSERYEERLEYEVRYLGIRIGTLEAYFARNNQEGRAGHTSGKLVMETFPGIGFLNVYTEYFSDVGPDGYFIATQTWTDEGSEWDYNRTVQDPRDHDIRVEEGYADRQFGSASEDPEVSSIQPGRPVHDGISFIELVRDRVPHTDRLTTRLVMDDKIHSVPVEVLSRDERISVPVYEEEQEALLAHVELDFEGIHGLRDDLEIWFSNDEDALPLHIRARIIIGSVRVDLVDYELSDG